MDEPNLLVILFNLGAPCCEKSTRPFLFNLFNDKAIITIINPFRWVLAHFISRRRAPMVNKDVYSHLGSRSPLIEHTHAQANTLKEKLQGLGVNPQVVVAMSYAPPTIENAVDVAKASVAGKVILLPLYPQFSTTTTGSAMNEWNRYANKVSLHKDVVAIDQYPQQDKVVAAHVKLIRRALSQVPINETVRVLFSAHGLPQKIVDKGDPYERQVHMTVNAVVEKLISEGEELQDWVICYQSKVGPLKWLEPSLDTEIERAGRDGIGVLVIPIAFVSEHSETLVELDVEYREMAEEAGVPFFIRVPTVSTESLFIEGLAELVIEAA